MLYLGLKRNIWQSIVLELLCCRGLWLFIFVGTRMTVSRDFHNEQSDELLHCESNVIVRVQKRAALHLILLSTMLSQYAEILEQTRCAVKQDPLVYKLESSSWKLSIHFMLLHYWSSYHFFDRWRFWNLFLTDICKLALDNQSRNFRTVKNLKFYLCFLRLDG